MTSCVSRDNDGADVKADGAVPGRAVFARRVAELADGGAEAVPALVDLAIGAAARLLASDLHLEPTADGMLVRLRLDGVMQDFGSLPQESAPNIVARCKVMAGLLSYRTDIPQEGGASGAAYGKGLELRISTFPVLHGEKVAVRLFDPAVRQMELDELGLSESVRSVLAASLARAEGFILLSGPAGCGKTTSLYASLRHIVRTSSGARSIVTIEDPIENDLAGVTQTAVNPAVGLSFARSLRSLLRQDPEVIMVGEVRDAETAGIVVEAALTGHLVLSTVHVGRAAVAPHRLLDMGVAPYALAGALSLVLAQRLVRALCPQCSRPVSDEEAKAIPEFAREGARAAVGCHACHDTGYRGRLLVAENLAASDALHDAIMAQSPRHRFFEIADGGEESIETLAWRRVAEGMTSGVEVRRVLAGGFR